MTPASFQAPLVAPDNVLTGVYARTCRGGQKKIEFVGEEKIRSRQQVPSLNRCARVCSVLKCRRSRCISYFGGSGSV